MTDDKTPDELRTAEAAEVAYRALRDAHNKYGPDAPESRAVADQYWIAISNKVIAYDQAVIDRRVSGNGGIDVDS